LPGPDASAEARFQAEVETHLQRNYLAHLSHGLLGQTGMRLVNAPTFIPAYVKELAGVDWAVGLARGLQYLGMFLSPILGATWIEHRRRVLPMGFTIGALMRVQVLGIALAGLLLPPPWPLYSVWIFLALFGFFLGIQGVVFNVLVSKVIPLRLRGRLMGLRNALAGLTAAIVAAFAGSVLIEGNFWGNGFASTFLLSFGLTSVGLLMLLFVREPDSPQVRERSELPQRLRELPALLRSDPGFTRYFLARALATMGRMAVPFYVLFAAERLTFSGRDIGLLTAAFVLTQSIGNLFWGALADRRGFRVVFLLSLGLWMLAVMALIGTGSLAPLLAVFAAIGAGLGGFQLSVQNLVLEFGSRRNLPMRIAVANSASELVAAFGAVLGGILSSLFSYVPVFVIALGFQFAALLLVAFLVDEPRSR
jgi:MFS family permease